jgi:formylglycine-generating enzyme required for sulfatase activity
MKIVRLAILPLLLLSVATQAQSNLPPEVRADLLVRKITASMEAGDAQAALQGLDEYRKLGVKMPPALLFLEARLAAIANDFARSRKALTDYFSIGDVQSDANYSAALTLMSDIEVAAVQAAKSACMEQAAAARAVVAARVPGTSFRECPFAPEMVIVPAGTFIMGSPKAEKDRLSIEGPQHQVSVSVFAAGKYEVTAEEFDACVSAGGCKGADRRNKGREAVGEVSWDDAKAYVTWLTDITGRTYRLLSEAEWEYAARAGTSTPWSTGTSITAAQANFFSTSAEMRAVGSYPANAFGLHDMHGNAWEWVEDCWNSGYAGAPSDGSAWLSGDCAQRVYRGGSWGDGPRSLRSAYRVGNSSGIRGSHFGFRVARTLD